MNNYKDFKNCDKSKAKIATLVFAAVFYASCAQPPGSAVPPPPPEQAQNTAAVNYIGGAGGSGATGGMGADVVVFPQRRAIIIDEGILQLPTAGLPGNATVISEDKTWTAQDNGEYGSGFKIAEGVTVTVPEAVPGGMNITVHGLAVVAGTIVRGPVTDGQPVNVTVKAEKHIVLTGLIDMSGPDSDGDGVDGGDITLDNDMIQDSSYGIFITGNIISHGGDGLYGGNGGNVKVHGGDNEDIQISGSIITDGGDAAQASEMGGDAGLIWISNYRDAHEFPTNDSMGDIVIAGMSQLAGNGGLGEQLGGDGGGVYIEADRGGVFLTVPLNFNGGDADGKNGVGGNAKDDMDIWSNWDEENLDGQTDLDLFSQISARGGNGASGGLGGELHITAPDGNLNALGEVDLSGGAGKTIDGGNAGHFTAETWDIGAAPTDLNLDISLVKANGGNGKKKGGDAGTVELYNWTNGLLHSPLGCVSLDSGYGEDSPGGEGTLIVEGNMVNE